MKLSYYDFNPGIIGLLIWGLISYFSRKKKRKNKPISDKAPAKEEAFNLDYFKNILQPQEIIASDPSISIDEIVEEIEVPEDISDSSIPIDKIIEDIEVTKEHQESVDPKKSKIGLLALLESKGSLRSAIIMKEILDQPVSLRNNE